MSILKRIFAGPDTISKTVDAAISAGDKIWYTEEEKAENKLKVQGWYLKLLDSMSPYNLAMRVLAFVVATMWSIMLLSSTSLYVISSFVCPGDEACKPYIAANKIEHQMTTHINEPFGLIMLFYFGAAGVNGAIRTYNEGKK